MVGAGVIKGCLGFGAPLIAVPLLAMVVGPKPAVILVSMPLLITNAAVLVGRPSEPGVARRFLPVLVALVPATFAGGLFLANANPTILTLLVGLVTVLFTILTFSGVRMAVPSRIERGALVGIGAVAGLFNGSTAIPGPVFAMYLSTLKLDKRAFVWGITLLLIVGNASQVLTYVQLGLYAGGLWLASVALAPAQLLGQQLGLRIQDRLDPLLFNRLVLLAVGLSGANLVVRSLV